ncbi:MAG: SufE family protein [Saprospiraceae bacterium]|nr:Fe-S metabolism protein SufE [Saprospirales bacterium]RME08379.1 MAG: SufE family protein [Bacteroidota bacterium]
MESINQIQDAIIEEFSFFGDWLEKYEYIIELGKDLPLIDEQYKTEDYLVRGCQSKVWLHANLEDGKVVFKADSDAVITKGIIALLIRVLSGHSPQEILDADLYFLDKIGLKEHLSPTRANGLVSMLKQMKLYALAFQKQLTGKNE